MLEEPLWREPTRSKPCASRPPTPSQAAHVGSLWHGLSQSWVEVASAAPNATWAGTGAPSAQARMRWKGASGVSRPSRPAGASAPKTLSPPCSEISAPSLRAKAKPTPHCARRVSLPGCVLRKSGANASPRRGMAMRHYRRCRRSPPRATPWATFPRRWPKRHPQKHSTHRGDLRARASDQSGRRGHEHACDVSWKGRR